MSQGDKKENLVGRFFEISIILIVIIIAWLFIPLKAQNMFVPSLFTILGAFKELTLNGELWIDIVTSLKLSFLGLLISTVAGIALGLLLGWFVKLERYLDTVLQIMRNTPVLSVLPIFVIALGIGDMSKIAIIVWATFFPILLNTIQGVKNVDSTLIRAAESMGIARVGLFLKVVLPASSPFIIAGFRLSAGVSLLVIVAAEMLGANHGLGFMIFNYQHSYQIPKMYVGIITLAVIGVLLNLLIVKLEAKLTRWQEKANAN
ncbi:MAG: ABC transporter permease [Clostridiales Family XIII bacterium]|jgi:NitT/TauT family transport system permease protein|nr:ABC transporter permease [Clostridiales Family XIII bacterium]